MTVQRFPNAPQLLFGARKPILTNNTRETQPRFNRLSNVAIAQIEQELALGKGLDVSNTLVDLAAKTARSELSWEDPSTKPSDLIEAFGQMFKSKAQAVAVDKGGTRYGLKK